MGKFVDNGYVALVFLNREQPLISNETNGKLFLVHVEMNHISGASGSRVKKRVIQTTGTIKGRHKREKMCIVGKNLDVHYSTL